MPAGQCVEPLSNGHKKISFNSPPTPNRTRNTINECYLGKRGHVIPLLSGLKPPSLGGTTINSFGNDYRNLANLSFSNPIFTVCKFQSFSGTQKLIFRNCRTSNIAISTIEEVANFDFNECLQFLTAKICQNLKIRASKIERSAVLNL